jgi:hypothetical protein
VFVAVTLRTAAVALLGMPATPPTWTTIVPPSGRVPSGDEPIGIRVSVRRAGGTGVNTDVAADAADADGALALTIAVAAIVRPKTPSAPKRRRPRELECTSPSWHGDRWGCWMRRSGVGGSGREIVDDGDGSVALDGVDAVLGAGLGGVRVADDDVLAVPAFRRQRVLPARSV